jgi:hypothetical protein
MMARVLTPAMVLVALLGCGSLSAPEPEAVMAEEAKPFPAKELEGEADGFAAGFGGLGARGSGIGGGGLADQKARMALSRDAEAVLPVLGSGKADDRNVLQRPEPEPEEQAAIRAWFPEAFLWRPSVVTEGGTTEVQVRVPDQLTTWRVLALAHDRNGHQAGTEASFATVLPVSIDPVVPEWLYVGDEVDVPVRTDALGAPFAGRWTADTTGAVSGEGSGSVALKAGGSSVGRVGLLAERTGTGTLRAEVLEAARVDGAERRVQVRPVGRPIETRRGGLLSGARTLDLDDPDAIEQRVVVRVFPGPLAVFQAELDRIAARPDVTAYGVIAGLRALADSSGVDLDEPALRAVRLRAWQRVIRDARSPDLPTLIQLVDDLQVGDDDPLASTTHDRLVRQLVQAQRGDGTFTAVDRTTVQHLVVQTAAAARALPASETRARRKAAGALERLLPNVEDPYTAAWVLASGVLDASLRPALEQRVVDGVVEREGRRELVPVDARGPFGRVTRAERLAVAWLALQDRDDLDWRGDLLAELLQGWSPSTGLGAGAADGIALAAIRAGMPSVDQPVDVTLQRGGEGTATGRLDPAQPLDAVVLALDDGGTFALTTSPAIPGLAYLATHTAWHAFDGSEGLPGVDVEVAIGPQAVGREGRVTLTIAGPSGAVVTVRQGLPAGVKAVVQPSERLAETAVHADHVAVTTAPFAAGEAITVELGVTPQWAGRFATRPLELEVAGERVAVAPTQWAVDLDSAGEPD